MPVILAALKALKWDLRTNLIKWANWKFLPSISLRKKIHLFWSLRRLNLCCLVGNAEHSVGRLTVWKFIAAIWILFHYQRQAQSRTAEVSWLVPRLQYPFQIDLFFKSTAATYAAVSAQWQLTHICPPQRHSKSQKLRYQTWEGALCWVSPFDLGSHFGDAGPAAMWLLKWSAWNTQQSPSFILAFSYPCNAAIKN